MELVLVILALAGGILIGYAVGWRWGQVDALMELAKYAELPDPSDAPTGI